MSFNFIFHSLITVFEGISYVRKLSPLDPVEPQQTKQDRRMPFQKD